jgi:hypothetical protein
MGREEDFLSSLLSSCLCYDFATCSMISLTIWMIGLILMAVQLARACTKKLIAKYPLFYIYLSCVLATSSCLLLIYLAKPRSYGAVYWYVEFLGASVGCAVVWEIYRVALRRFPGAARMARNVLVFLLALALSNVIADAWRGAAWWPVGTVVELERDLRGVQGAALIGLIAVIAFYRIPLGANLWGMTLGYGLLVSSNMITLTLRAFFGARFQTAWLYLQPVSYLAVLSIWCMSLWSYKPATLPARDPRIEQDYQLLARTTSRTLLQASNYLRKALRP